MTWVKTKGARSGYMKACLRCGKEFYVTACRDIPGGKNHQRYCSRVCYKTHMYHGKSADDYLWKRVDKNDPSGCWVYRGASDRRGYGRPANWTSGKPKRYYAHRRSYEIHKGPIPEGMLVLHKCNNPPCCNPEHLYVGTDLDNAQDRRKAGTLLQGEKAYHAKLNDQAVREIRRDYRAEGKRKTNSAELAARYGVSHATIRYIIRGHTWSHLK